MRKVIRNLFMCIAILLAFVCTSSLLLVQEIDSLVVPQPASDNTTPTEFLQPDLLTFTEYVPEHIDTENLAVTFNTTPVSVCNTSSTKTYMPYTAVTSPSSKQYQLIQNHLTVDEETGLLYDEYGFIAVALGSYYGNIGDRFLFVLDNGTILPVIKADAKSDAHTMNGCSHSADSSVIEFVIDTNLAAEAFGRGGNGLVAHGNFNNIDIFEGRIAEVKQVTITYTEQ